MRILTLLNKYEYLKSFVYVREYWEQKGYRNALIIDIKPRKNSHPVCSGCDKPGPIYDHKPTPRDFQFVPIWGTPCYFRYRMRRVDCPDCGVKVEQVPWASGKSPVTHSFGNFLSQWAKRLTWKEVADTFHIHWNTVYKAVRAVVEYGLKERNLDGIEALGVDEIQYGKGQQYLTLVYQLDNNNKRLLFVEKKRTMKSLLKCFRGLTKKQQQQVKYICSDMWKSYLKVIKKKFPQALNILDRFHIVKMLNKAVDEVRREEVKRLKEDGYEPVLNNSKYCWLKNEENLTENQTKNLNDVLQYDLKTVRAYLLKESFQAFWQYTSPYWAQWFLKKWCTRTMRSRLEPMKKFVKTMRRHEPLLMNWFKANKAYSSGTVEGLNRKINLVTRKSYGFRSFDVLKIALFHTMGGLPEPKVTHSFL